MPLSNFGKLTKSKVVSDTIKVGAKTMGMTAGRNKDMPISFKSGSTYAKDATC